jgi:hypothetical protein
MRRGIVLFFCLLIYDGALRKWMLPGYEQELFVAKDLVLLVLVITAAVGGSVRSRVLIPGGISLPIAAYATWVVLESFNLSLPNLGVGIWGVKAHLLYAALLIVLPTCALRIEDHRSLLERSFVWIVAPVCLLAFVQFRLPAESFLNTQVRGGMEMISYFGDEGHVRVTGTFSYITGMAYFVQIFATIGIALLLCGSRNKAFLVGLVMVLTALPITGSRSVVVVVALSAAIMAVLTGIKGKLRGNGSSVATIMLVAAIAIYAGSLTGAWDALAQRAISARQDFRDEGRVVTVFTDAVSRFDDAGLFGYGAGSANYGANSFTRGIRPFSWLRNGANFEEESGRIVLEIGIIGWLLSLVMRISIFVWALFLWRKAKSDAARFFSLLAVPQLLVAAYVGNGVFSPPLESANYWWMAAMLSMVAGEISAGHNRGPLPVRRAFS